MALPTTVRWRAAAPYAVGVLLVTAVAVWFLGRDSGPEPGAARVSSSTGPSASAGFDPAAQDTTAPQSGGNPAGAPVTEYDLEGPVAAYQSYVSGQLALLRDQTKLLRADLAAGDVALAKTDWLTAHLTYHRMGAAYDAFGDLGSAIDGGTAGTAGRTDPRFTGFHRIESLLWSNQSPATALPFATTLERDVATLAGTSSTLTIDPNALSLRAHEILEDTLQFELTGRNDYGSGTGLATAAADLAGTRTVVGVLTPVLQLQSPGLAATATRQLDDVQRVLTTLGAGRPGIPVTGLPLDRRQRLDAAVGRALETLALVPGLLEIRDKD